MSDEDVTKFITEQYAKMRQPVAGYDLVFTPVKSISLLWGLGDAQVKEASKRHISRRRRGPRLDRGRGDLHPSRGRGARKVKAEGLLIARFDHFDNRVGDPNLHTHSAILNRVLAEGKWTTIDGQVLYKANVAASERYNTRVADLVARKLGVTFAPRPDTAVGKQPVYEVEGIPVGLLEEFSRRAQIEDRQAELAREYKDKYGKNPPKKVQYAQAQQATLDTGTRRTRHDRWQSCAPSGASARPRFSRAPTPAHWSTRCSPVAIGALRSTPRSCLLSCRK